MQSRPQLTPLLSNETLARVERMRLCPNRRLTNRTRGEHAVGTGGASIDFSDYRDYVAGDDIRYVDWNIFARLQRPYLKLYAHEEELHVVVLLDASSSMVSEEKYERARQLAAAFSTMALLGTERLSLFAGSRDDDQPAMLQGASGRQATRLVFEFLEHLVPGGDSTIDATIASALRVHRGRGIAIVLSDFLTTSDMTRSFNRLNSAGLEILAVQILGPNEIEPDLTGDVRLVDCETGRTLDVSSARDLLDLYHEHRSAMQTHLSSQCRRRNGRFESVSSAETLESILFETLLRRGWIR
ncbi:MAG: DUF58 domain-containing protein [Rhodopirellula sp.]|nr:DUF58 domain-containing protein [Rhodopirellula sp.]